MRETVPPRFALWVVGCLLSASDKDAVIGDLTEEYTLRARSDSLPNTWWWCWGQVTRSVPPLLWAGVRRGYWLATLGAAIAGYVLVHLVESVGGIAVSRLLGLGAFVDALIISAFGVSAMVFGGYVAARIRRGAAAALAVISALSVVRLMATAGDSEALWFLAPFLVSCPLAALAGGALLQRQKDAAWADRRGSA